MLLCDRASRWTPQGEVLGEPSAIRKLAARWIGTDKPASIPQPHWRPHLDVKRPTRAFEEIHQVAATRTERRQHVQVTSPKKTSGQSSGRQTRRSGRCSRLLTAWRFHNRNRVSHPVLASDSLSREGLLDFLRRVPIAAAQPRPWERNDARYGFAPIFVAVVSLCEY